MMIYQHLCNKFLLGLFLSPLALRCFINLPAEMYDTTKYWDNCFSNFTFSHIHVYFRGNSFMCTVMNDYLNV